jgi:uncharacterized protein (DUF697 family)
LIQALYATLNIVRARIGCPKDGEYDKGAFMTSPKQRVHDIIQAASSACAGVDRDLQVAISDSAAIVPIQTTMIMGIASQYGIAITNAGAGELLLALSATMRTGRVPIGRQALVGWVPGIDNATSDSTAAALTEAIGWAANAHFEQANAKMKS